MPSVTIYPNSVNIKDLEGINMKISNIDSPVYLSNESGEYKIYVLTYEDGVKKDGTKTKIPFYFEKNKNGDLVNLIDPKLDFEEKIKKQEKLRNGIFQIKNKIYAITGYSDRKIKDKKSGFESNYIKISLNVFGIMTLIESILGEQSLPKKNDKGYRPFGWEEEFIDKLFGKFIKGVKDGAYISFEKGNAFEVKDNDRETKVKEA